MYYLIIFINMKKTDITKSFDPCSFYICFFFKSSWGLQYTRGKQVILFSMQASVEDRLRSLELTTEALTRRLDSLAGQRQMIAQESSVGLEESRQQLARPRPRLQPIQNPPARTGPINNAEASRLSPNEQTHYYYPQPAQPSSTAALGGQRVDFGRYPQGTIHPQANFMGGVYPQYYAPESAPDNKWQCWSCCMLWFGLLKLLSGMGMLITGAIFLNYYLGPCDYPFVREDYRCCYKLNCNERNLSVSFVATLILLTVGFAAVITGIIFLTRARRIYRNNSATCCE